MARASSVVSARAMALDNLTQPEPKPQLADFCSAPMAGFYAAVDTLFPRDDESLPMFGF